MKQHVAFLSFMLISCLSHAQLIEIEKVDLIHKKATITKLEQSQKYDVIFNEHLGIESNSFSMQSKAVLSSQSENEKAGRFNHRRLKLKENSTTYRFKQKKDSDQFWIKSSKGEEFPLVLTYSTETTLLQKIEFESKDNALPDEVVSWGTMMALDQLYGNVERSPIDYSYAYGLLVGTLLAVFL